MRLQSDVDMKVLVQQIEDVATNSVDGSPVDRENAEGVWNLLGRIRDGLEEHGTVTLTAGPVRR